MRSALTRRAAGIDSLLEQLQVCLDEERSALVEGVVERLDAHRQAKDQLLQQLNGTLPQLPVIGDAARRRVAELRRLNELNAALLAARAAVNRGRLDALVGAAQAATYGAGGHIDTGATLRHAAAA